MSRLLAVMLVAGAAVAGLSWNHARTQEPNQVADFMRHKLEHAKDILEGLSLEDYEMIAKNAQDLSLISLDSTWQVLQTDEYARQSSEFRRTANALTKAADNENLDGAALAYVELTMKCVNCHKYVRSVDD